MTPSSDMVNEISGVMRITIIHQLIKYLQMHSGFDVGNDGDCARIGIGADFENRNAWQREPRFDPSELIFIAMNPGFSDVIGVMVITLEASQGTRQFEMRGEIR